MDKMPVNHERVSATAKKVTPVLKGGKLQEEVEKQKKGSRSLKRLITGFILCGMFLFKINWGENWFYFF